MRPDIIIDLVFVKPKAALHFLEVISRMHCDKLKNSSRMVNRDMLKSIVKARPSCTLRDMQGRCLWRAFHLGNCVFKSSLRVYLEFPFSFTEHFSHVILDKPIILFVCLYCS